MCYFHPPLLPSPATAPPIPFCEEEINKRRGKRRRVVEGQKKKANYQAFNAARPRAESALELEKNEFQRKLIPLRIHGTGNIYISTFTIQKINYVM